MKVGIEHPFALIACEGRQVVGRSANLEEVLAPLRSAPLDRLSSWLPEPMLHRILATLEARPTVPVWVPDIERTLGCHASAHVRPDGTGVIEFEPAGGDPEPLLQQQRLAAELEALCRGDQAPETRLHDLLSWLRRQTGHEHALVLVPSSETHLEILATSRRDPSGTPTSPFIRTQRFPPPVRLRFMAPGSIWVADVERRPTALLGSAKQIEPSFTRALDAEGRELAREMGVRSACSVGLHRQRTLASILSLHSSVPVYISGPLRRTILAAAQQALGMIQELQIEQRGERRSRRSTRFFDLATRLAESNGRLDALVDERSGIHHQFDDVESSAVWTAESVVRSAGAPAEDTIRQLARAIDDELEGTVFSTNRATRLLPTSAASGRPFGLLVAPLADGTAKIMLFRDPPRPWLDADRELAREIATSIDRLSVVQLEQLRAANLRLSALAARAEMLDTALRLTGHAVVTCELREGDTPIIDVGGSFEAVTGYPAREAIGRSPRFLQGPDTDPEARRRLREAVRGRSPLDVRLLNYRRDGTPWWNDLQLRPLPESPGRPPRMVAVQRDARMAMQAEREQARSTENRVLHLVTRGFAHDLSNLLMAAATSLSVLEHDPRIDAGDQELIAQTVLAAERARLMLESLRASAEAEPPSPTPIDLDAELRAVLPLYQAAVSRHCRVELDLQAGPRPISAAAGLLQSAVLNLILNADRAMPRGGTVHLRTRQVDHETHPVILQVEDHGEGMAPETLARATEPFFTSRERRGGTGLGLTMVRRFAEGVGAHLDLDSEVGRGTTVTLRFRGVG